MSFYKVQNVLKKERKVIVYESYTGSIQRPSTFTRRKTSEME